MRPLQTSHEADSPYAWTRLGVALALMTIGGSGMYSMAVALPPLQAEFGIARADASLPYTLTMIGFGFGGILMGKLADRFGVIVPVLVGSALGGWMPGWIFDATGSYRAAFANGIAWNLVTTAIALFLLYRARIRVPREA
jgi:MFS family permease